MPDFKTFRANWRTRLKFNRVRWSGSGIGVRAELFRKKDYYSSLEEECSPERLAGLQLGETPGQSWLTDDVTVNCVSPDLWLIRGNLQ